MVAIMRVAIWDQPPSLPQIDSSHDSFLWPSVSNSVNPGRAGNSFWGLEIPEAIPSSSVLIFVVFTYFVTPSMRDVSPIWKYTRHALLYNVI